MVFFKHRKHYFLSAEGVFYFILAGIDVLAHVLPGPRRSLTTFMGLDIFVGVSSKRNSMPAHLTRFLEYRCTFICTNSDVHCLPIPSHDQRSPPGIPSTSSSAHQVHSVRIHSTDHTHERTRIVSRHFIPFVYILSRSQSFN